MDEADFDWLNQWKWYARKYPRSFYARRNISLGNGKRSAVELHRFIMNAGPNDEVDHRNNNGLDNRRENLRIATIAENRCNKQTYRNNKSGFKGVFKEPECNRWRATIGIHGEIRYLGLFPTAIEAAIRYDQEAIKEFGAFAHLNFPHTVEVPLVPGDAAFLATED